MNQERLLAVHRLYELGFTIPQLAYIFGITEQSLRTSIKKAKKQNNELFRPRSSWIRAQITISCLAPPDNELPNQFPGIIAREPRE